MDQEVELITFHDRDLYRPILFFCRRDGRLYYSVFNLLGIEHAGAGKSC
jgi:hypothetical protein